tara:strand:- start:764 stop:982 length:219 start_codon:yes stop_codon:yes gene_type:complete
MKKLLKKFWDWVLGLSTVDEKIVSAAKETKRRAKLIKEEAKDVAKAVKEVGNQIDDIADAAKGKARKGRKKK